MAIAGRLEIELMANVARLSQDMNQAKGIVGNAAASMERSIAAVNSAMRMLGLGVGVGGLAAMLKAATDTLDKLNDLSKTTRIAAEDLAGLRHAANLSGTSLEAAAGAVNKLATNMGKNAEKFAALGVSARDPIEALKQLADVTNAIADPQQRAAVLAEALGKSWQQVAPLLAEGSAKIGEMVTRGREMSGVTQELVEQADEFNDKLAELAGNGGRVNAMLAQLLPLLNASLDGLLANGKATSLWEGAGQVLAEILRVLVVLGGNVAFVFKAMGIELGGLAAQAAALANGDFARFAEISREMKADAQANRTAFDAWEKSIMAVGAVTKTTTRELDAMDQVQRRMAQDAGANARAFLEAEERKRRAEKDAAEAARALAKQQREDWDHAYNDLKRLHDELKDFADTVARILNKNERDIERAIQDIAGGIADSVGDAVGAGMDVFNAATAESVRLWTQVGDVAGNFFADLVMNGKSAFDNLKRWVKQLLAEMIALFAKRWVLQIGGIAGGSTYGSDSMAGSLLNGVLSSWVGSAFEGFQMGWMSGVAGPAAGYMETFGAALKGAAGALSIFGAVIAGIAVSARLYSSGWGVNGETGIGNSAGRFSPEAHISGAAFRIARALGINEKWSSILSGQTLVARTFGHAARQNDAYGIRGQVGPGGIMGENWQDWSEQGGWTRNDNRGTDPIPFTPAQRAFLDQVFRGISGVTGALGGHLGVDSGAALGGYSRAFNFQLNENGEPLTDEQVNAMFNGLLGTVLQEQVSLLLDAGGKGELAEYIRALTGEGEALTAQIVEFVNVMVAAPNFGLDIEAVMAMQRAGETLSQTLLGVAQAQQTYYELFYTEEENVARNTDMLKKQFAALGLEMPTTREGFRALVESLDLSTEEGSRLYRILLEIAPAFASVADAADGMMSEFDALMGRLRPGYSSSRAGLQITSDIDAFQAGNAWSQGMTDEQFIANLRTITREDFANYSVANQALILSILDLDDTINGNTAVQREVLIEAQYSNNARPDSTLMQWVMGRDARRNIADYLNGSLSGNLSPLDPMGKFGAADSAYQDILKKAQAGDIDAMMKLPGAREAMLDLARQIWGSSSAFVSIFERSFNEVAGVGEVADYNTRMLAIQTDSLQYQAQSADTLMGIRDLLQRIADRPSTPTSADNWSER